MIHNIARGVQAFSSNAFLVAGERNVLVDAGANFDAVSHVRGDVDHLDAVVLTHTHEDHVGNVPAITEAFDVEVWGFDPDHPLVDHEIEDEDTIQMGNNDFVALHTPGHKDDHLCFYSDDAKVLFAGDLVFQNGNFGRTDLEGGDRKQLIASIERVLDVVDEDLQEMHVGHGPSVIDRPYDDIEAARRNAMML